MKISTIGIDLAKEVFQVHAADARGKVVLRKKFKRNEVIMSFRTVEPKPNSTVRSAKPTSVGSSK